MNHLIRIVASLGLSLLCAAVIAAGPRQNSLVIGVVPYNSATVVIGQHRAMIDRLRADFGGDVEFVTAPGFRAFFDAAANGDYDVMGMPSHFARLLQLDRGYVPLVRYESGARALVVVATQGPISSHEQLAGKVLAVPDRTALATILVLEWLEQQGMRAGRDYTLFEAATFNAAAIAVERGEAAAAISAPSALVQMSPETRAALRTIVDSGEFPNLVYVAHPRLSKAMREKLKHSLLSFVASPAGQTFSATTGFKDIVAVTPQTMQRLDPYMRETRRVLGWQAPAKSK